MSNIDISVHNIETIYVAQNSTRATAHYFVLLLKEADGLTHEITIYGNHKMPEVKFGDPDDE